MLKARATTEAGDLLVFGLSARNLELLQLGQPILVDLREIGLHGGHVLIFFGETEDQMLTMLRERGWLPAADADDTNKPS